MLFLLKYLFHSKYSELLIICLHRDVPFPGVPRLLDEPWSWKK